MTFFYSTLGILMFSGILLISKHATLFANKNNIGSINSSYIASKSQQVDRYLLSLLNSDFNLGSGTDICYNLLEKYVSSGYSRNDNPEYIVFPNTLSNHQDIINSCVLSNGKHRILIRKTLDKSNKELKYSYNSCILMKKDICSFEVNI